MAVAEGFKWVRISSSIALAIATAAISVTAALLSASIYRRRSRRLASRVRELEASLAAALEKGAAERRGRVRAQQELRKALTEQRSDGLGLASSCSSYYPMAPIGTIKSCFSTRNGTPRQPSTAPLARACLVFDQARVPPKALDGLADFSHCWIVFVFHLNTDLEKLWKHRHRSKFKAKVRVPRLKGGKMGVLATRSPHRPCPIGLTVAKVEALDEHAILLSGVDLVDGTPVLDIKPYLPYSDCIQGATIPNWVKVEDALAVASVTFSADFISSLSSCWVSTEKHSLYASVDEFQNLIQEVLSWDIRSLSQRSQPYHVLKDKENHGSIESSGEMDDYNGGMSSEASSGELLSSSLSSEFTYHLILEGVDISYRIDDNSNVIVEKARLSDIKTSERDHCNYSVWREKLGR